MIYNRPLMPCLVLSLLVMFGCSLDSKKNDAATQQQGPPIAVTPDSIVKDYEENEVSADQKYKGKILEISGTVDSIGKDILDKMYITFKAKNSQLRSVQCYFSDKDQNAIAGLKKGQKLTVKGRCDGLMMNVLVKDCSL